jgi:hypothetical protein
MGEGWMRDLAEYGASLLVVLAALALSYWLILAFVR